MAKSKTLMDIFDDVAQRKYGVDRRDIAGRQAHFEAIMTDAMRIFNKRLKERLRRNGTGSDSGPEPSENGGDA